jgi:hypothetical protein
MKILIITDNVGRTAPGIVFEKLIQGLSTIHQIDLLTADYCPTIKFNKVAKIIISKKTTIHPRISNFFISYFGTDPFDIIWAKKSLKKITANKSGKYDIVLSFLSYSHYSAMIAGFYYAQKNNIKYSVHTTDAIPPPLGWLNEGSFYNGLKKMMNRYLQKVDVFFSTNQQMLNYQLNTFKHKENLISNVIYNPGLNKRILFPEHDSSTNYFVYTGGIYGVRKVEYILNGFEKLLHSNPDSKLIFVGSKISLDSLSKVRIQTIDKIELLPFSEDLSPYYACAIALIDIDADLADDVFISSKMPIYLMINRIIISETGINSPSRHLFKNIQSIIQCDHDADQLCEAMKRCIDLKKTTNFDDRNDIVKLFQIDNIVNQIDKSLKNAFTIKAS